VCEIGREIKVTEMKLMTALKLRPGSIPIIGNNLEANGTRHWTGRLSSSAISVILNLIIVIFIIVVIVILFFIITETHYKNPKMGTRERWKEQWRLIEMVLSELGHGWENKGKKGCNLRYEVFGLVRRMSNKSSDGQRSHLTIKFGVEN